MVPYKELPGLMTRNFIRSGKVRGASKKVTSMHNNIRKAREKEAAKAREQHEKELAYVEA